MTYNFPSPPNRFKPREFEEFSHTPFNHNREKFGLIQTLAPRAKRFGEKPRGPGIKDVPIPRGCQGVLTARID